MIPELRPNDKPARTVMDIWTAHAGQHSDIREHMVAMTLLAAECNHVTEFGVRWGVSTSCWLVGCGGPVVGYDTIITKEARELETAAGGRLQLVQTSTLDLISIAETDLLFIDTLHTFNQVDAELAHARSVRKYVVLHDTELNGWHGENGTIGILPAVIALVNCGRWRLKWTDPRCNGLTVLERK